MPPPHESPPSLAELWSSRSSAWLRFARTPGRDAAFELVNLPVFLELLPPPGRAALDVGCGEGRIGRLLTERGYRVTGIDVAPGSVEAAREHHEAIVADAAELPFADGAFDLVYAFMTLMDFDDLDGAVAEDARVLEPGGRFVAALVHPFGTCAAGEPYFEDRRRTAESSDRLGVAFTFHDIHRPLGAYLGALERAGLLVEAIREPVPGDDFFAARPNAAHGRLVPLFLHLCARKG